jgi:hypothetical protein
MKRAVLGVFLLYFILSLITTYPLVLHFNSNKILGDPTSDIYTHLWNYWWVKTSFAQGEGFPLRMDLINYPKGGSLFSTDALNSCSAAALQTIFSPVTTYNLITLYEIILAAAGAYCLALYLVANPYLAFSAGIIFGFSPLLLSHCFTGGVLELGHIGWLPFCLLFIFKTIREPGWKNPLLGAICFFLSFFAYVNCGFFLVIILMVLGIYWALVRGAPAAFSFEAQARTEPFKASFLRLVVLFALALLLTLPPMLIFLNTLKVPDSILPPKLFMSRQHLTEEFGPFAEGARDSYLSDYLLPGKSHLVITHESNTFYHTVYLGWLTLGLILFSLKARKKFLGFWWALALLGLTLSIGPYLQIMPGLHLRAPLSPLYLFFFKYLPYFSYLLEPFRFAFIVNLAAAVLVPLGAYYLFLAWKPTLRNLGGISLGLLIWLEFICLSPQPYPLPETSLSTPEFYYQLAQEPESFAILELPLWRHGTNLMVREYFYWQTIHHKATAHVIYGSPPPYLEANPFTRKLLSFELENPERYKVEDRLLPGGFKDFKRAGFKYIILHQKFYKREALKQVENFLNLFCPSYAEQAEGLRVYRILSN